jgi:cytochrome c oxidase cbb3-type subunit I
MIAQLTRSERQGAILISLVVAVIGLLLGLAGRDDPVGVHGALIFAAGLLTIFLVGRNYYAPQPSDDRLAQYYDDPSKAGLILAMLWAVFGLAVGDWAAWQLVNPDSPSAGAGRALAGSDRFTPHP